MQAQRKLLDATRTLVAQKGIRGTTVAEIANTAGVAKGLLFYHYGDKNGLVRAVLAEVDDQYMADLAKLPQCDTAMAQLQALFSHHFDFINNSPDRAQFLYHAAGRIGEQGFSAFYEHLYERIIAVLEYGIERGEFAKIDAQETAYMMLGSLHGVGRLILFDFKRDYDAASHFAAFYDKVLRRLG